MVFSCRTLILNPYHKVNEHKVMFSVEKVDQDLDTNQLWGQLQVKLKTPTNTMLSLLCWAHLKADISTYFAQTLWQKLFLLTQICPHEQKYTVNNLTLKTSESCNKWVNTCSVYRLCIPYSALGNQYRETMGLNTKYPLQAGSHVHTAGMLHLSLWSIQDSAKKVTWPGARCHK